MGLRKKNPAVLLSHGSTGVEAQNQDNIPNEWGRGAEGGPKGKVGQGRKGAGAACPPLLQQIRKARPCPPRNTRKPPGSLTQIRLPYPGQKAVKKKRDVNNQIGGTQNNRNITSKKTGNRRSSLKAGERRKKEQILKKCEKGPAGKKYCTKTERGDGAKSLSRGALKKKRSPEYD